MKNEGKASKSSWKGRKVPLFERTMYEKGHGWTKPERTEMDCIWVNLENVGPPFLKFTVCQFIQVSKCHLLSWKIILSCYVAMILQMKDSWSANLTFRAHNR